MYRSIDVRTEMRRLATSKPVYAAAGAGVLASQTFRALPARIARLRAETPLPALPALPARLARLGTDTTVTALPAALVARLRTDATVSALPARATEYMLTARALAAGEYDKLASRGRQVLGGGGPGGRPGRRGNAGPASTRKG